MKFKYVTIITARGGSKRFPGKNIYPLQGKPLIGYSIEYSINNPNITQTFVTTDSEEIKAVSEEFGATVIDRPEELSGDYTTSAAVLKHAVEYLIDKSIEFDYVVLLQPTNPLRPNTLLDQALEIIEKGENDSLFTVSLSEKKLGKIIDNTFVPWNYHFGQRSQDLEHLYYENGLLYISSKEILLDETVIGATAYPLIVHHPFGNIDIDTYDDFLYAQYVLNQNNKE